MVLLVFNRSWVFGDRDGWFGSGGRGSDGGRCGGG